MGKSTILSTSLLLVLCPPSFAATLRVPQQYPTIQGALDASIAGDIVLVSQGTYPENIVFPGRTVILRSVEGPQSTVIDGMGLDTVVRIENQEGPGTALEGFTITNGVGRNPQPGEDPAPGGILVDGASANIVSCVVTGNQGADAVPAMPDPNMPADPNGLPAKDGGPGGIWCSSSPELSIVGCTIASNRGGDGTVYAGGVGGLFVERSPGALISTCVVEDNFAGDSGQRDGVCGGLDMRGRSGFAIEHTIIRRNRGGTTTIPRSDGCGGPGGLHCQDRGRISHCVIRDNVGGDAFGASSNESGAGGIHVWRGRIEIDHCVVLGNRAGQCAGDHGKGGVGGIFDDTNGVTMTNTVVAFNIGGDVLPGGINDKGGAGGINSAGGTIVHCTIALNLGGNGGSDSGDVPGTGGVHFLADREQIGGLYNTIVYGNSAVGIGEQDLSVERPERAPVEFCNVRDGYPGRGNIDANPRFVDPQRKDFHLAPSSPCIGTGSFNVPFLPVDDLEGDARSFGRAPDIGADETDSCLPGSGEDLILQTTVNSQGNPVRCEKLVSAGDSLTVEILSPASTFADGVPLILIQGYVVGSPPPSIPGFPEVQLGPGLVVAYDGRFFGSRVGPTGFSRQSTIPPRPSGIVVRIQGVAISRDANNGRFATTEAHEVVYR